MLLLCAAAVALTPEEQKKTANMLNTKGEDMALWAQGPDLKARMVGMLGPSNPTQCELAANAMGWVYKGCRDSTNPLEPYMPAGCYVTGNDPPHVYFNAPSTQETNPSGCGIYGNWCISGTPQSEPFATTCLIVKPRASAD